MEKDSTRTGSTPGKEWGSETCVPGFNPTTEVSGSTAVPKMEPNTASSFQYIKTKTFTMKTNSNSRNSMKMKTASKEISPAKIRILIADDHQMILDGIRTMLESHIGPYRFSITEADNGEEAVSKVKNQDFDVVLLDYQM